MTKIIDLERKRGNTRRVSLTIENKDGPIDISKWTRLRMVINTDKEPTDTSTLVETIVGALIRSKKGSMYFVPSGKSPAGNFYYEATCFDDNRESFTFLEGKFTILQDIPK
jgi:hypothetical protein